MFSWLNCSEGGSPWVNLRCFVTLTAFSTCWLHTDTLCSIILINCGWPSYQLMWEAVGTANSTSDKSTSLWQPPVAVRRWWGLVTQYYWCFYLHGQQTVQILWVKVMMMTMMLKLLKMHQICMTVYSNVPGWHWDLHGNTIFLWEVQSDIDLQLIK